MNNKVTPTHIEQLYAFTSSHFVAYYDLQTELTDHLANAIEAQWQTNPELTFDDALQLEFKKFGVYGFKPIVDERKKTLNSKYRKLIWKYFIQFFTLPRILLTGVLLIATFKLIEYEKLLYMLLLIVLMATILIKTIVYKGVYGNKVLVTGKRWMLEEIIFSCGSIVAFMGIPFQLFHFVIRDNTGVITLWVLSLIFVLAALAGYVMVFVIPAKAEEHLAATYPEYNLEKTS